jgi:hypothetical protein
LPLAAYEVRAFRGPAGLKIESVHADVPPEQITLLRQRLEELTAVASNMDEPWQARTAALVAELRAELEAGHIVRAKRLSESFLACRARGRRSGEEQGTR